MKRPETATYVAKARRFLVEARIVAANDLPDAAGRAAYLAAFHMAQAYIFEQTGKVSKTHSGVRSQFAMLARGDGRIDPSFPAFLGRGYTLKSNADYALDPAEGVTADEASKALAVAEDFVATVAGLLEASA